ncbi:solute carrier family 35, member B1 [Ectocarpus siliculosus]|uniref:Solute carrier family 35, member B1 n=1 Tax=Ectocarpus siliculosus TaxID=2880 RepID=D7G7H9_ECTSI|nr:solute carrier family 35, member B1 [Ectocarpus siliculosus]|eukprot:CBJ27721.1 solute carrier family 35, member B1 [Ectocarpus siliculosus]
MPPQDEELPDARLLGQAEDDQINNAESGVGAKSLEVDFEPVAPQREETPMQKGILLFLATVGLLGSYVTWGFMQEMVKNKMYGKTDSFAGEKFPSDVFLVFGNRLLAMVVAAGMVMLPLRREPAGGWAPQAPWLSFAPCSLSNVMSSFCQYRALNFISFPMQVVSKSCKVVPVMLVGKFVHGKSYPWVEYLEAVAIAMGVSLFSLSQSDGPKDGEETHTNLYGIFFIASYLVCDSFTSQWQDRIFKKHKIDQYQMMFGVNCFSILFTTTSLLWDGGFAESFRFLSTYPAALYHVVTLSVTSATGQLFIFYTIKKFGPIIFTIIMTTRQMVSLVVSAVV